MHTMNVDDARKDWQSVMDSAIQGKPIFLNHGGDTVMLASIDTISELASGIVFLATAYYESNGSVTLSLNDIDIIVNGKDMDEAKAILAKDILGYAQDYYASFAMYFNAPNRRSHLPFVIKALATKSPKELEAAILCQIQPA